MNRMRNNRGFTLVELVITIMIIGVLGAVAIRQMQGSIESSKYEATKTELDQLAFAIAGNPDSYSSGTRADFGYIGDVGAIPASLTALAQNPGGYTTWNGPYIGSSTDTAYKRDGWGSAYQIVGTAVRSTGSGSNIDRPFGVSSTALLSNSITGTVIDANGTIPGTSKKDSIKVILSYPNGTGGTTTSAISPDKHGSFSFSGIPIGTRMLKVAYTPTSDTISYAVTIYPGKTAALQIRFPTDLF